MGDNCFEGYRTVENFHYQEFFESLFLLLLFLYKDNRSIQLIHNLLFTVRVIPPTPVKTYEIETSKPATLLFSPIVTMTTSPFPSAFVNRSVRWILELALNTSASKAAMIRTCSTSLKRFSEHELKGKSTIHKFQ